MTLFQILFTTAFMLLWLACGVYFYGIAYAYFVRKFPRIMTDESIKKDQLRWLILIPIGPLGFAAFLACEPGKHGLKFYPRHGRGRDLMLRERALAKYGESTWFSQVTGDVSEPR